MATINEKLADSLAALKRIQERGYAVIEVAAHPELTRAHRERLVRAGFLRPVIKGWYLPDDPAADSGDSTQWFAHMEAFVAAYANARFGPRWQLSPEMSLLRQSGHTAVFKQMQIHAPEASNQILALAHGSSMFLYKIKNQSLSGNAVVDAPGLRILPAEEAVVRAGPSFFTLHPLAAQIIVRRLDISVLSRILLEGESAVVAGRMTGALDAVGRADAANQLRATIKAAGINVSAHNATPNSALNPFAAPLPDIGSNAGESPYVQRIRAMWAAMRGEVITQFKAVRAGRRQSVTTVIKEIEARYTADAYHSLSIEGYKVSDELIERVRRGDWNPVSNARDQDFRDAMAAKGYFDAHTRVVTLIRQTLTAVGSPRASPRTPTSASPGAALQRDFPNWFPALFSSSVTAGILRPADLAGYRNSQVFIRNAQHVPLAPQAVRDCMPALFDLISGETHPGARAVLGHFFFVFIHPYMDGNGRLGRFLMNYLLVTGGHRWVIVPVQRRAGYMAALGQASTHGNIKPFARFIAGLMVEQGTRLGKNAAPTDQRRTPAKSNKK